MYKAEVTVQYIPCYEEVVLSFNVDLSSQSDCDHVLTTIINCEDVRLAHNSSQLKTMFNTFRGTAREEGYSLDKVKVLSMPGVHINNMGVATSTRSKYYVKISESNRCDDTWVDITAKYVYIGMTSIALAYLFSRIFK